MDPNNAHSPIGWPFIGATPLYVLVVLGSKSAFDALLQKDDVEVDGRDSDGNTPLHLTLRDCHQDMALALLNRSIEWQPRHGGIIQDKYTGDRRNYFVDINAENDDGETPLTIALTVDADEVILKLIEMGADLIRTHTWPVFYAIYRRNKTLLLKLLEKNVKLDGAVYFALKELSFKDCDNVLEEFLLELLKAEANTDKSPFDKSPEDQDEDMDEVVDEDMDERDDEALLLASRRGQTAIVSLLLSHGASATSQNKHGRFPLLVAAENGHESIVKLLLENGGDIDAKNPLHHDLTPLWGAFLNGHEAVAMLLIDKGANTNVWDENGTPLFVWVVHSGHEAVVRFFIDKGADINASDGNGLTALLWALRSGHEVIARLLIDRGADVNVSDDDGLTALLWASRTGYEAIVRLLIDKGADVNARDGNGLTALLWASRTGHEAIVRLLIDNGANIEVSDKDGLTSLLWASRSGHKQ